MTSGAADIAAGRALVRRSSPAGSRIRTFSSTPGRVSTASAPSARSRSTKPCTSASGADAPAVTPTAPTPSSQAGSSSSARSIRWLATPVSAAISRNRFEFELFFEPITSTRSTCRASSRTARCRFWVA